MQKLSVICILFLCNFVLINSSVQAKKTKGTVGTIKVGVDYEFSNVNSSTGEDVRKGIKLALDEANNTGFKIGGKKYTITTVEYDNKNKKSKATKLAMHAVMKDKVVALILPLRSGLAIQAAGIANNYKTPAVTTVSSSPEITKNRPYVFRISPSFSDFSRATKELAEKEWQAKKVAIIYDELDLGCKTMAKTLKKEFIQAYGAGANPVFLAYRDGDKDFSKQLKKVIASDADFLYLPVDASYAAVIIKQAQNMGWKKPITGSDWWVFPELLEKCGKTYCKGMYCTANFAAKGVDGAMKAFTDKYKARYRELPSEVAAFGYEAMNVIIEGLKATGGLSGKLQKDRTKLRDAISGLKYKGASGEISWKKNSGEPVKCAIVVKIDNEGEFSHYFTSCAK